jgi:DEAD/DEAH box helicase domain-containing protein
LEHSPAVATLSAWGEANPAAIRHVLQMPARSGRTVDWPEWVPAAAVDRWRARGIQQPWEHQVLAAQAAVSGSHVAIATGTASGKSLAFAMPIVASIVEGGGSVLSDPCALYLAPTKALANDQWRAWEEAALPGVRPAVVDGDTNTDDRAWARRHANVVLTNPDMLHYSILPGHERWSRLFRNLRYIVVDEAHAYRGVFGAHVSLVLRRLIRIAEHYGSSPVVIAASATSGAPERSAERLIGAPAMAITEDCSPSPERSVVLWQSPNDDEPSSATRDAAALTSIAVEHGCQVLTFLRSRRAVEYVASLVRDNSNAADLGEDSVAAYRGGYLAEERRDLEAGLRSGRLRALASTNALELGIDVAGMDAVITAGWPGTRSSLWQQFGRAGRGESPALAAFIAREDPLDTYLVEHPDAITAQPFEETVFDPSNPHVLLPHLAAAASELPITEDEHVFPDNTSHVLEELVERGLLRKRPTGWYWTSRERPHDMTDLRGSGETVRIVEEGTGRLLGTVDAASAHRHVHPGAVYVHQGVSHTIRSLDLDDAVAIAVQEEVDYTTFARDISDIRIRSITRTWSGMGTTMFTGEVEVMSRTVAYEIRALDGTLVGLRDLDLPERLLTTQAVWWTIDDPTVERAGISDLPGAVHAAEHAAIGLLPLFASCDRWDIGGVSTIRHPDTGLATIFIYDGLPGGAGFTARGAEIAGRWLGATADAVSSCSCRDGCPSCVQSPKCGNGNDPLSKADAVTVLRILTGSLDAIGTQ